MILVGTVQRDYNARRNILSVPFERYKAVRGTNIFKYPNHAFFRIFNYLDPHLSNIHLGYRSNVDIYHFFNMVSLGATPWVSTYETMLPRWAVVGRELFAKFALQRMASGSCKRLIAMSGSADRRQRHYLQHAGPIADVIVPKMTILHPPQAQLVSEGEKVARSDEIVFTIIGADFFRKGGLETLRAIDALLRVGIEMRLNIVSQLQYGDYASRAGASELEEAKRIIARHPKYISHRHALPNAHVLDLLKQSDVALLPTFDDTYGYSVLEAQACGCPVITTNVRALPEINNEECGWVIHVEKNDHETALFKTPEERRRLSECIEAGLRRIIREIVDDPRLIALRGDRAIRRIGLEHSPARYAARLEGIYQDALS